MRWYLIHPGEAGSGPWVLAETPDKHFALATGWRFAICVSREQALADPEFRSALLAWDAGDDRAYGAWIAVEDAVEVLRDAAEG